MARSAIARQLPAPPFPPTIGVFVVAKIRHLSIACLVLLLLAGGGWWLSRPKPVPVVLKENQIQFSLPLFVALPKT